MSDILATTGLEKGGVYRHFASKDELAVAAFDHAWQLLRARYLAVERERDSSYDRLIAFIDVAAASVRNPVVAGGCPLLNTAIDADDTHPALRERAGQALREWQGLITSAVGAAVDAKELRTDVDPSVVASVMTSAIEGAIMTTILLRDYAQMDRTAAHLRDWLASLRPQQQARRS